MEKKRVNLKHGQLTDAILRLFYKQVYAELGYGFLEQVYENAMVYELRRSGLEVAQQQRIDVHYSDVLVGEYFADLVVERNVIVELKAAAKILPQHEAQLLNYLRATHYEVGLLLNFGPEPSHRRRVFDNAHKRPTRQS